MKILFIINYFFESAGLTVAHFTIINKSFMLLAYSSSLWQKIGSKVIGSVLSDNLVRWRGTLNVSRVFWSVLWNTETDASEESTSRR